MRVPFSKYVGCGNDFILFDNRAHDFPLEDRSLISKLCHRQCGIGADGIVFLESSLQADFRMRIFNRDGSEAEMCGNGIRCLMRFIQDLGFNNSFYHIETMQRLLKVAVSEGGVCVEMGNPTHIQWDILFNGEDQTYELHYLNTGVPHIVLFIEDIDQIKLDRLGPYIRYHSLFAPEGTNVNLAQVSSSSCIKIRTYERGVEGETLACGTGATAVALATAYKYGYEGPLSIETRLKENLIIDFRRDKNTFRDVTMTGPAYRTFQGTIFLN